MQSFLALPRPMLCGKIETNSVIVGRVNPDNLDVMHVLHADICAFARCQPI